jgi:hypothetical protein
LFEDAPPSSAHHSAAPTLAALGCGVSCRHRLRALDGRRAKYCVLHAANEPRGTFAEEGVILCELRSRCNHGSAPIAAACTQETMLIYAFTSECTEIYTEAATPDELLPNSQPQLGLRCPTTMQR